MLTQVKNEAVEAGRIDVSFLPLDMSGRPPFCLHMKNGEKRISMTVGYLRDIRTFDGNNGLMVPDPTKEQVKQLLESFLE